MEYWGKLRQQDIYFESATNRAFKKLKDCFIPVKLDFDLERVVKNIDIKFDDYKILLRYKRKNDRNLRGIYNGR